MKRAGDEIAWLRHAFWYRFSEALLWLTGWAEGFYRILDDWASWACSRERDARNAYSARTGMCNYWGCLVTEPHYHRDTLDGEEIVRA